MLNLPRISTQGRWLRVCLAAAILLCAGFLALSSPGTGAIRRLLPCGFHAMSGLPCLFCGGSRALGAILHGNVQEAIYLNVVAFPAVALLALAVVVLLVEASAGRLLAPWEAWLRRMSRFAPILILPALAWWMCHIYFALRTPKPELVDFRNPIAARARAIIEPTNSQ